jgi:hypothetical protein
MFECRLLSIKTWSIWLCVTSSGQVQVCLWMSRCGDVVLLTIRFFEVAKFTTLTPLPLLASCRLLLPIIGLI